MSDCLQAFIDGNHKRVDAPYAFVEKVTDALKSQSSVRDQYAFGRGYPFPWGHILEWDEEGYTHWGVCMVSSLLEYVENEKSVFLANLDGHEIAERMWAEMLVNMPAQPVLTMTNGGVAWAFGWVCESRCTPAAKQFVSKFLECNMESLCEQLTQRASAPS